MSVTLRRADRRLRRRRPRRADAQGGHSRRIVGADPDAGSARHAGELRRDSEGRARCSARRRSSCSTTRPAWCGSRRTCCTSTATSRAASARRAARGPTGCYKILQRHRARRGADAATSICSRASRATSPARRCARSATPRRRRCMTTLQHFRHEYEAHIREGRCTLPADWRARAPGGAHA